jgi:hypothetical protein
MFLINNTKDQPLYQELLREGVMTASLWESLELPPEGYVMDVIIGHRVRFSEKAWVDWLIRKHECTRIPALLPDFEFIKKLPRELIAECLKCDCYPLQVDTGHVYVGIGRPDYPEVIDQIVTHFGKGVLYRNALTLNELSELREIGEKALQTA